MKKLISVPLCLTLGIQTLLYIPAFAASEPASKEDANITSITVEVEDFTITSGNVVDDANASNGKAVLVETKDFTAEKTINFDKAGVYLVDFNEFAPDSNQDSFYVVINGDLKNKVKFFPPKQGEYVMTERKVKLNVETPGEQTIKIIPSETGMTLDKIVITETGEAPVAADVFTDIKDHWAGTAINSIAKRGILKGNGDGTFKPEATLTYAEAVTMFLKALYIAPEATVQNHWADPYINAAVKADIVKSGEITNYDSPCSREYVAVLASRGAQYRKDSIPAQDKIDKLAENITDLSEAKSTNEIKLCFGLGIVNGESSGTEGKYLFNPDKNLTRAEAATIVERLLNPTARAKTDANSELLKSTVTWDSAKKMTAEWFRTSEGIRVADNVLLYQRNSGGWPKNIDMAAFLSEGDKKVLLGQKSDINSTFDNGATFEQMLVLAQAYNGTKDERYKDACVRGLDYIFKAQYANGGWPQYYPDFSMYRHQITYNDNAMIHVLTFLEGVVSDKSEYSFIDDTRKQKASEAIKKGIDCILKTQIVFDGKKTAWCQQYDEVTLQPATARAYELLSISGSESVGIVQYLMNIKNPSAEVIDAIQSAVTWLNSSKITGIRVDKIDAPLLEGGKDVVVVKDPNAKPIWARYYEIDTNTPFFCGRDGIKKYNLAEIEVERRVGYSWYGYYAEKLFQTDYPVWQQKYAPDKNVLK